MTKDNNFREIRITEWDNLQATIKAMGEQLSGLADALQFEKQERATAIRVAINSELTKAFSKSIPIVPITTIAPAKCCATAPVTIADDTLFCGLEEGHIGKHEHWYAVDDYAELHIEWDKAVDELPETVDPELERLWNEEDNIARRTYQWTKDFK